MAIIKEWIQDTIGYDASVTACASTSSTFQSMTTDFPGKVSELDLRSARKLMWWKLDSTIFFWPLPIYQLVTIL